MSARKTALEVLRRCRTHQAWADAALGPALRRSGLTGADAPYSLKVQIQFE